MTNSFHQIPLHPKSRPLTAFSTDKGHFQFKRLPFGLKISTNSFQRMLSLALSGLQDTAFLYVDDIIVFGTNLVDHNNNLTKVFERLRKYNLKLNPEKCNFLKPEVTYLGHLQQMVFVQIPVNIVLLKIIQHRVMQMKYEDL